MSATEYDKVLYPSYTHPQTHPERLAVLGLLHGMTPAPVTRCRVLELGCGSGDNILPMAWSMPGSEFVGVDLAETPIRQGQQMAAELGLGNIRLVQADVAQVAEVNGLKRDGAGGASGEGETWGRFDYIIAHGLYSWVPGPIRERILALVQQSLAPQGIAFISYNALPGGYLRNMVREMMLMHVRGFDSPKEKMNQAVALLKFLAEGQDGTQPAEAGTPNRAGAARGEARTPNRSSGDLYRLWLKGELETVLAHEPGHLYHDELAEYNEPFYFTQFVRDAEAHGLQYLSEADYFEMFEHGFAPSVKEALAKLSSAGSRLKPGHQTGATRILREQYLDFLKCRRFRQTLLCHKGAELKAEASWEPIRQFSVSANCTSEPASEGKGRGQRDEGRVVFLSGKGARCETDWPLGKAALGILGPRWPTPMPFCALLKEAAAKAGEVLEEGNRLKPGHQTEIESQFCKFLLSLYAAGMVDFSLSTRGAALHPGDQPATSPISRWQARRGMYATSLFHVAVKLEDEVSRSLLTWLDGTRTREQLLQMLWDFLHSRKALDLQGKPEVAVRLELAKKLEENLQKLARMGLLVEGEAG